MEVVAESSGEETGLGGGGVRLANVEGMLNGGRSPAQQTNLAGHMDAGLISSGW